MPPARDWDKIARLLKPVHTAPTEEAALDRFAEFADAWRTRERCSFGPSVTNWTTLPGLCGAP